jgi:tetratricopeptide (TPR) repeat protein
VLSALDHRGRAIDVASWLRARYPAYAPAWSIEALLLARAGRSAQAEVLADSMVAQPLAPSSAVVDGMRRVAAAIAFAGDSARAGRIVARVLELIERDPSREEGKRALDRAKLLYESGRLDDAASLLERLAAQDTSNADIRGYLGFVGARRRDAATVASVDAWLAASHTPFSYTRTLYRARIAALVGQRERALALLSAALDEANRFLVPAIREYPELALLRREKRFEQLLALR